MALPAAGTAAAICGAVEESAFRLRPNLHIAPRWRKATAAGIRKTT